MNFLKFATPTNNRFALLLVLALIVVGRASCCAQEFKYLEVTVADEEGQALAGVPVGISMDGLEFEMSTNQLGMISLNVSADGNPVQLRVRKSGFESQKMRWDSGRQVPATYTMKLQRGKPSQGRVVNSRGKPAVGTEVFAATPDQSLTFLNGENIPSAKQKPIVTDSQGRFSLPHLPIGSAIVCLSPKGWAQQVIGSGINPQQLELKLVPWLQTKLENQQSNQTVGLYFLNSPGKGRTNVSWLYRGKTNKQAQVTFDRVIHGTAMAYQQAQVKPVKRQSSVPNRSHGTVIRFEANTQHHIILGGAQQKAQGKLFMPVDYAGEVRWESGYVVLTENNVVDLAMRTMIFEYGKLLSQSGVMDPTKRVPPSLEPNYLVRYLAPVKPDGTFVIEGVPPGQYKFSASLAAQPKHDRDRVDLFEIQDQTVSVPQLERNGKFDLGEYILDHTNRLAPEIE